MIRIGEIEEEDIELINELFEEECVYVANSAKFKIDGDTIYCLSSNRIEHNEDKNLIINELKVLKIKKIVEMIGYEFIDLRQAVNN